MFRRVSGGSFIHWSVVADVGIGKRNKIEPKIIQIHTVKQSERGGEEEKILYAHT